MKLRFVSLAAVTAALAFAVCGWTPQSPVSPAPQVRTSNVSPLQYTHGYVQGYVGGRLGMHVCQIIDGRRSGDFNSGVFNGVIDSRGP